MQQMPPPDLYGLNERFKVGLPEKSKKPPRFPIFREIRAVPPFRKNAATAKNTQFHVTCFKLVGTTSFFFLQLPVPTTHMSLR